MSTRQFPFDTGASAPHYHRSLMVRRPENLLLVLATRVAP